MKTYTLYTCTGQLQLRPGRAGVQEPVVVLNRREQGMEPAELILWSRLCWRFRDREQLWRDFEAAGQILPPEEREEAVFDRLLSRLTARGLIVAGEGDTQVDALYDLLSNLYVTPIDNSFFTRLTSYARLVSAHRVPTAAARKLLKKDRPSDQERRILSLARQALLSTAELVKCEETNARDISDSEKLLDALYYDDATTCYNIAHLMRRSPKRDGVVLAVSNLYLSKQILFQRACL